MDTYFLKLHILLSHIKMIHSIRGIFFLNGGMQVKVQDFIVIQITEMCHSAPQASI